MAAKRPLRTKAERDRARDFVRYLGGLAESDAYDLADKAGLPRETVRGWWYGAAVPDGLGLLEILRAAGVLAADYRLPVSRPAERVSDAVQEQEDLARQIREGARKQPPAHKRESG